MVQTFIDQAIGGSDSHDQWYYALLIGALLALDGVLTLGQVYLIFAYTALLEHLVEELQRQLNEVQQAVASLTRVAQLFALQPQLEAPTQTVALPTGALSITVDTVSSNLMGIILCIALLNTSGYYNG